MTVNLDKQDLINLVLSLQPRGYTECEEASKKGFGELDGFPNERWTWNRRRLDHMQESTLLELYNNLKTTGKVN